MRIRLGLTSGIILAALGVAGLAGGGILWNFQGRELGLGSTISALVLLSISFVLLRPTPKEATIVVTDNDSTLNLQAPKASITGLFLAAVGTFGLATSGILWNFKGLAFGLTGTITSVVALLLSFLFLWPLSKRVTESVEPKITKVQPETVSEPSAPTTAEEIARELAEAQKTVKPVLLTTYAPDYLLPGQTLPNRRRKASSSLKRYKEIANELFSN